jgi:hypothetical protein
MHNDNAAKLGPGKYGDIAERVLREVEAKAVLLIVIEGYKGSGMSMSEYEFAAQNPENVIDVPLLLRNVAAQIDKSRQ